MRKLRLNVDELEIESFDTRSLPEDRGTLHAHQTVLVVTECGYSCESTCAQIICGCTYGGPNNGTCDATCNSNAVDCTTVEGGC